MAALLTAAAANTTGSGASHSGPATVFVRGTFDGATVVIQVSDEDVSASYVKADNVAPAKPSRLAAKGSCYINATGTYYIRCIVSGGGSSTAITAVSTQ